MTEDARVIKSLSNQSLLAALQTPALRETLDTLIVVLDRQGHIVSFNAACERATGYQEAELRGAHFRCLIPLEQQDSAQRLFDNLVAGAVPSGHVNAWQGKQGRRNTIQWTSTVLTDPAGAVEYIVASGIDITAYQASVTELLETSQRYRALVETSNDWIWELDARLCYAYTSPRVEAILGYAPEEILGKTPIELMPPEEADQIWAGFEAVLKTRQSFQHRISSKLHKSGYLVYLESSGVPFFDQQGELAGYRGVSRDITRRYRMEQALRESEQRLRLSQQFANIGTWEWDIDSGALYWSDQIWPMFGYPAGGLDATYSNFLQVIHPDDLEMVIEAVHTCLEEGRRYEMEHRVVWPDGQIRWVRETGNVLKDEAGRAQRMMGVIIDIDSQKAAELRLVQSEQKYRALIDNAVDAIILLDGEGKILDVNRHLCRLYGHDRTEMIGQSLFRYAAPEHVQSLRERFGSVLTSDTSLMFETEIEGRRGERIAVEVHASVLRLDGTPIVQGILRDIRERKQLEAQRLARAEAQRDTLVREVHHRIKNSLQGIVGLLRSELQTEQADPEQAVETAINQIQSIALVHGVYGQRPDAVLLLCEMLPAIAQVACIAGQPAVEVALQIHTPLQVKEEEAVALALILNELITNSRKHSENEAVPVQVVLETAGDQGTVQILAPGGRLPADFDFGRGVHCGTGLELVRALLPRQGLDVRYEQTDKGVVTWLMLGQPVITSYPGTNCRHAKETASKVDRSEPSPPAEAVPPRSGV